MTSGPAPICLECIHFWNNSHDPPKCDAFPSGIPRKFTFGGDKNKRSIKCGNKIAFEEGKPREKE